jgi:hypothetical protein
MKKVFFVLFTVVFISLCAAQSQSDYYGTWVYEDNNGKMEYFITATIFTATYTPRLISYISPITKNTFEIFSWERIESDNWFDELFFPTGFLLGLRNHQGYITAKYLMADDKKSFIHVYKNNGREHCDEYIKQ